MALREDTPPVEQETGSPSPVPVSVSLRPSAFWSLSFQGRVEVGPRKKRRKKGLHFTTMPSSLPGSECGRVTAHGPRACPPGCTSQPGTGRGEQPPGVKFRGPKHRLTQGSLNLCMAMQWAIWWELWSHHSNRRVHLPAGLVTTQVSGPRLQGCGFSSQYSNQRWGGSR